LITIEISKKSLFHVILALRAYEKTLLEDEEDPGPSQADALLISHLSKTFKEKYDGGE
jgi:hypothetical protein